METPFTVYKLIILYMLSHSDTELTNSQLSEFILDRDYTNYFHLQQAISELVEAGLIYKRVKSNSSYYQMVQAPFLFLNLTFHLRFVKMYPNF